jgi:AraC family transcriptional regulator of adaptative response/methylated-DNA-[protein]-cysteine methyltransferase
MIVSNVTLFGNDEERWRAVRDRDDAADGHFCYVVRTTGVYSRPSCVARPARRENILFFGTIQKARAAGYRPCRRCRPDEPDLAERYADVVTTACRVIEKSLDPPSLDQLARTVGFSRFHFHRLFKAFTGVTPHAYLSARRARRVRYELSHAESVSDAIYNSGFSSTGHFYAASSAILGMTPTEFRSGGRGVAIHIAVDTSSLGPVLVAVTDKGVCAVLIGDDHATLRRDLERMFPHADYTDLDASFAATIGAALAEAEPTGLGRELLPADIRTVVMQERIYQAVRGVPRHLPDAGLGSLRSGTGDPVLA